MKAIVVTSFGGPEVMKYTDFDIPAISRRSSFNSRSCY